jgi:hypothetical protein
MAALNSMLLGRLIEVTTRAKGKFKCLGRQNVDEEPIGVKQNVFEAQLQVLLNANAFCWLGSLANIHGVSEKAMYTLLWPS